MRLQRQIAELLKGTEEEAALHTIPYLYEVAMGNVPKITPFVKMGYNGVVNNSEEDVWSKGAKYTFPTTPQQMQIISDNANDAANGSGIQQVKIYYLDGNFAEKTEVVTLNGASVVSTVATDIYRVNALRAYKAGTGLKAAGNIDLRNITSGTVYRAIAANNTRGRSLIYTVPIKKTLYITSSNLSVVTTNGGHYGIFTLRANYDDNLDTKVPWMQPYFEIALQDGSAHYPFDVPIEVPATCDLVMSCISDAAAANAVMMGGLRGYMVEA